MSYEKITLLLLFCTLCLQNPIYTQRNTEFNVELSNDLWKAAKKGDAQQTKKLLDKGADPNATFRKGGNALLFASDRGHLEVIKVLLENGADVNAKEEQYGWTALIWAAYRGHTQLIPILVEHGIDVNAVEAQQNATALWWATWRKREEFVKVLLESTEDIHPQILEKALATAIAKENTAIAKLIAEAKGIPKTQNWASFRGNHASGVAETDLAGSTEWNVDRMSNIKWKVPVPGLGLSSPIIWGDQIFITSAEKENQDTEFRDGSPMETLEETDNYTWKIYCIDKNSGFTIWSKKVCEGKPKTKRHPKNSYASPTPATDGKYLVAYFGSEGTYCYDLDGNLLWKKNNGAIDVGWFYDPDYQWGVGSSPIIYKDLVYIQSDVQENSVIIAYDLKTGKKVWSQERDEVPSWCTPTIYKNEKKDELITNGTKRIRSYDPLTGEELWWIDTNNSMTSVPTPVIADDVVFITNGDAPKRPIYAIKLGARGDLSLKEEERSNEHILWSKLKGGPYVSTPIVYDGYFYICTYNGVLACYDAKSGERMYKQRFEEKQNTIFYTSPVAAAGHLYCISEQGDVYVIKSGPEYQLVAKNPMGEDCLTTPAISDGLIFIRTQSNNFGNLICIEKGKEF